jgi:hypothetical protein
MIDPSERVATRLCPLAGCAEAAIPGSAYCLIHSEPMELRAAIAFYQGVLAVVADGADDPPAFARAALGLR